MLDNNALSQLKSLKQEIHNSIPRHEGKVRSTAGRFGFVVTDDNQQFYLSPDEMEKVLPADRIAFRVETTGDGKEQAIIEKLISTEITSFCGRYFIKGKGHFIEADHPALNRWLFVPPKARQQAKDGALVSGHLTQHPYPHGKAQASIDQIIGMPEDAGVESTFMCAKWQINDQVNEEVSAQVAELINTGLSDVLAQRVDHTNLDFVTIDSQYTRDLDDALYVETQENGWKLWVAIADPASLIPADSALDKAAQEKATSVYFANRTLPMLPPELSEQLCSLAAGEQRPALVLGISVADSGEATLDSLELAKVSSKAKLSYQDVANLIDGNEHAIPEAFTNNLLQLKVCANALNQYRQANFRIAEERPDYRLILDEQSKVKEIVRQDRNSAHKLVEECMLLSNRLCADWLGKQEKGFFIEQAGIRTERIGDVVALLREQLNLEKKPKLRELGNFLEVTKLLKSASELSEPVESIMARQMEKSVLTQEAKPHLGLGFPLYTTMTSPLRKYNDLLIHRLIAQILTEQPVAEIKDEVLEAIQDQQYRVRMASNQTDSWAKLIWLSKQSGDEIYEATIQNINANYFAVRLDLYGIDGMVDRKKAPGKWKFDSKTLSHFSDKGKYQVGQSIKVQVQEVNPTSRALKFLLID